MLRDDGQDLLRVLLDQNVPRVVAAWMRQIRTTWIVTHTSDLGLDGRPDTEIFDWAQTNGYLIITFDADFADTRTFPVGGNYGVIRLRVKPTTVEEAESALSRLLAQVSDAELRGALVIVARDTIRVRRSTTPRE